MAEWANMNGRRFENVQINIVLTMIENNHNNSKKPFLVLTLGKTRKAMESLHLSDKHSKVILTIYKKGRKSKSKEQTNHRTSSSTDSDSYRLRIDSLFNQESWPKFTELVIILELSYSVYIQNASNTKNSNQAKFQSIDLSQKNRWHTKSS